MQSYHSQDYSELSLGRSVGVTAGNIGLDWGACFDLVVRSGETRRCQGVHGLRGLGSLVGSVGDSRIAAQPLFRDPISGWPCVVPPWLRTQA